MRKKRSSKTKWIITLVFVAFAAVLTISILMYRPVQSPKKTADQYFSFSDVSALGEYVNNSTAQIKIKLLYFNFTAIGGDAHHVAIFGQGLADPGDYYYLKVANETSTLVEMQFQFAVMSAKQEQGYPIEIRIYCDEAEGYVTLYVPESNVIT
jgi:hypothetical protein